MQQQPQPELIHHQGSNRGVLDMLHRRWSQSVERHCELRERALSNRDNRMLRDTRPSLHQFPNRLHFSCRV